MAKYFSEENILESVSVDCVIFGFDEKDLKVLLIKRQIESEEGIWALPGGYVLRNEHLVDAPKRILSMMANVGEVFLRQVGAFGAIGRFPLSRTITVAYYALIDPKHYQLYSVKKEALEARWFGISELPALPYDHTEIVENAMNQLRVQVRREPIGIELLPEKFSLRQMQNLYEAILGLDLDNRNFRRKIFKLDFLEELKEKQQDVSHRKANLFKFNKVKYHELLKKGIDFEI